MTCKRAMFAGALLSLVAGSASAADGQQLFNLQCKTCHVDTAMGPKLRGAAGGQIASNAGYAYSTALKAKAPAKWTDANLDAFLKAPTKFAPGTKMVVAVPQPEDREAVISYLKALR